MSNLRTTSPGIATTIEDTDDSSESDHDDDMINEADKISPIEEAMLMKMPVGSHSNLLINCEDTDYTHMTIFEAAREGSLVKIKSQVFSAIN